MFMDFITELLSTLPYAAEEMVDTVGDAYVRHIETPFVRFTSKKEAEKFRGKKKTAAGTVDCLKPYNRAEAMCFIGDDEAFEQYMRTHTADGRRSCWDNAHPEERASMNQSGKEVVKEMLLRSLENMLPDNVELDKDKVEEVIDSLLDLFGEIEMQVSGGETKFSEEDEAKFKEMLKKFGIDIEDQQDEEESEEEESEEGDDEEEESGNNEDFVNDVIKAVSKDYKAATVTQQKMYDIMMSGLLSDDFFDMEVSAAADKLANMMNLQKRQPKGSK